ncbi:MAG: NADH-quinone oxidoreductase subunit J [Chloroflexi bacterium]|nr:NADH-quinone oxidoreductase subunit J [Chloroflexota bacterium]
MFQEIVFWLLAIVTVGAAVLVVHTQNMFRAALLLVVSFFGVAGIFVLLNAEFLAVVQVLIYAGGVSVLVIFAVMITSDVTEGNRSTPLQPAGLIAAVVLLGTLIFAIVQAEWTVLPDDLPVPLANVFADSTTALGSMLLNEFVLPFEIAGVVLLAAVIGALSLVRER